MRALLALALVIGLTAWIAPAGAEVAGPCEASVEDVPVEQRDADEADDAIPLPADRAATMEIRADQPIDTWDAKVHYGPFSAPLTRGEAPPNATYGSAEIPVNDFAWIGVGTYRVSGVAELGDGSTCEGETLVEVEGSPHETVLGTASITVAGIGGLGLLGSIHAGYREAIDERP